MLDEKTLLDSEAGEVDYAVRKAQFAVKLARESDTPDPMWALASDWTSYNNKVADAQRELEKVRSRQSQHNEVVANWQERWNALQEQINNLVPEVQAAFANLQHAKGNRVSIVDPETGMRI
jgi:predicted  nucleic acid-binding Zn-ribbon protein